MSEAVLQADLKRELLRLTAIFGAADVVINDWRVLDNSNANAPYAIIEAADDFSFSSLQTQWRGNWSISFLLVVKFDDWDISRAALQSLRQSVIDALRDTRSYNSASIALQWGLRSLSAGSPIGEIYDRYNQNPAESLPVFLSQQITAEVEEIP